MRASAAKQLTDDWICLTRATLELRAESTRVADLLEFQGRESPSRGGKLAPSRLAFSVYRSTRIRSFLLTPSSPGNDCSTSDRHADRVFTVKRIIAPAAERNPFEPRPSNRQSYLNGRFALRSPATGRKPIFAASFDSPWRASKLANATFPFWIEARKISVKIGRRP